MRHSLRLALLVGAAAITACVDTATGPTDDGSVAGPRRLPLAGLIVSEAIPPGASMTGGASEATAAAGVTYVSQPPGTLIDVASVRIRNLTTDGAPSPSIAVIEGGFDPVAVAAGEGDELEIELTDTGGSVSLAYATVPAARPPSIVRTGPPSGRRDVALNVHPEIVFSEPIDPASVSTESVRLLAGGEPVAGEVEVRPVEPWLVLFTPASLLQPETTHELVIARGVRDLSGDPLTSEVRVSFTTAEAPPPVILEIVSGNDQKGKAGQELAEPFVVRVTDGYGAPIAGAEVLWGVDWGFGVLGGRWDVCAADEEVVNWQLRATVTTDAEGLARMSYTPTAFSIGSVRAELPDLDAVSVRFSVDARDLGASIEVVSGNAHEASAGLAFEGEPLVVRVKDGHGVPVPNVTVIWSVDNGVLGGSCSKTYRDYWNSTEMEVLTFWYGRTAGDGTAAIEFRPGGVGRSEVRAWTVGMQFQPATFSVDVTSLVISLSGSPPSFLDPHAVADAGIPQGRAVEFLNRQPAARIVSTSAPPGAATFDSGMLHEGERFRFVPGVAGTWEFKDDVSGATGTLTARSPDAGKGLIHVSNVTTGGAFDLDDYRVTVRVPGSPPHIAHLELNYGFSVGQFPAGPATVEIDDLAANCSVNGQPRRSVSVAAGVATHVSFEVSCTPPPELADVRLVFSRGYQASQQGLWTMNADGSDLRRLASGAGADYRPIVSPDGSRIAFTRFEGNQPGIHVLGASGTRIIGSDPHWAQTVAWSWLPDGDQIAIQHGNIQYGTGRVDIIGADGTGLRTLVNDGNIRAPVWSPDGGTIAFYRYVRPDGDLACDNPTGGHEIWTMNADGGDRRLLRRMPGCRGSFSAYLSWSRDGSRVLFSEFAPDQGSHSLWSMNPDGSDAVRIWDPGRLRVDDFWNLSADGRLLLMTVRRYYWDTWLNDKDIFLLDLETGAVVRVTADGQGEVWGADFVSRAIW